ncbi:hypothetical protein [Legionella resiliens]|uniref:BZIP transcription factor n=1 Tax=Legionella resiliens TaxID=2905958 RepID=A0ABS8X1Y4_9GAMM|nr:MULTISPECIES: hypothetical protein [unclassified Legionella]MCE0722844.1 hypothetical protein [Legionella sp. 9fVS26]MCE3531997.1 hypothetical protein [Legionella sp. 8cVS16]
MFGKNDFFDGIDEFDFLDSNFDGLDTFGEKSTSSHLENPKEVLKQNDEPPYTPSDLLNWPPFDQFDLFPVIDSQPSPQVEHRSKKRKLNDMELQGRIEFLEERRGDLQDEEKKELKKAKNALNQRHARERAKQKKIRLEQQAEALKTSILETSKTIKELEVENNALKRELSFLSGLAKTVQQICNHSSVEDYFSRSNPFENPSLTPSPDDINATNIPSDLITMDSQFLTEDTSHYLHTENERAPYLVHFNQGKLYNYKNEVILDSRLLYVLDKNNNLYAVPSSYNWSHSWFFAGQPVKAAGFIETDNTGEISSISNESEHYKPTMLQMLPALRYFSQQIKLSQSPEKSTVVYESHDRAKEGIILTYLLKDIARLNGEYDINNVLHKLTAMGRQNTKKTSVVAKEIQGYETKINDDNSEVAVSRYGLGPNRT